jgi:hypothetical protein
MPPDRVMEWIDDRGKLSCSIGGFGVTAKAIGEFGILL